MLINRVGQTVALGCKAVEITKVEHSQNYVLVRLNGSIEMTYTDYCNLKEVGNTDAVQEPSPAQPSAGDGEVGADNAAAVRPVGPGDTSESAGAGAAAADEPVQDRADAGQDAGAGQPDVGSGSEEPSSASTEAGAEKTEA